MERGGNASTEGSGFDRRMEHRMAGDDPDSVIAEPKP